MNPYARAQKDRQHVHVSAIFLSLSFLLRHSVVGLYDPYDRWLRYPTLSLLHYLTLLELNVIPYINMALTSKFWEW